MHCQVYLSAYKHVDEIFNTHVDILEKHVEKHGRKYVEVYKKNVDMQRIKHVDKQYRVLDYEYTPWVPVFNFPVTLGALFSAVLGRLAL